MRSSGVLTLTETSPPQVFTEPLTVSEMRHYLRLPEYSPADYDGDALIASMISAARDYAESVRGQNRDLVGKQWDYVIDSWENEIHLRDTLATVDLVEYRDIDGVTHTLVENTDYIVDMRRNVIMPPPNGSWPSATLWPTSAILIRFTTRNQDVPATVLNGMRLLISDWHTSRTPFDTVTERVEAPYAVSMAFRFGRYQGRSLA